MSRRRIWLIIIGILMAGVSATWEMEKFVSSHGVNTAAVVGFEADAMQPDAGNSGNPYMTENRMKVAENTPAAQNAPAPACGPADNGIALYHADAKASRGPEDGGEASDTETRMKESATKENAAAEAPDAEVSDLSLADNDQLAVSGGTDEAAGIPVEETVKSPLEPDSTASENAGEAKLVIEYTRSDLEERLEAVRIEAEK